MMSRELGFFGRYILLLIMQLLLCNYFMLSPYILLTLLPVMVLSIPLRYATPQVLLISFVTALAVDFLADGVEQTLQAGEVLGGVADHRSSKAVCLVRRQAASAFDDVGDAKKDMVTNAARFVYALPDDATAADLRQASPRDVWYVGGITDENAREVRVKLDFLKPGMKYEATIYADAPDADYETNPQAYTITRKTVTSKTVLKLRMARAGGFAVSLRSVK